MTPEDKRMWEELERPRTKWDQMNECHKIEIARMEEDHQRRWLELEAQIIRQGIDNDDLGELVDRQKAKIDRLWLALFALGLFAAYLVRNGK